jgi:hypothetical protein
VFPAPAPPGSPAPPPDPPALPFGPKPFPPYPPPADVISVIADDDTEESAPLAFDGADPPAPTVTVIVFPAAILD